MIMMDYFTVRYEALASADVAHHVLVFGCRNLRRNTGEVWLVTVTALKLNCKSGYFCITKILRMSKSGLFCMEEYLRKYDS
jgi:hypothetical protein